MQLHGNSSHDHWHGDVEKTKETVADLEEQIADLKDEMEALRDELEEASDVCDTYKFQLSTLANMSKTALDEV